MAGLEEIVLDACLHDRAYDPQCEGDRTSWLMEIIDASGAESLVLKALISQRESLSDTDWDATQRCRILRELALRGHPEARSRLYESLRLLPGTADVVGAEDIIAIDGAKGLLHVAEYLGMLLRTEPGFWVDDYTLHGFDEAHGLGAARRVLDAETSQSQNVAEYLRHLDEREQAKSSAGSAKEKKISHINKLRSFSGAAIVEEIETSDPEQNRYWFSSWGLHAPVEELSVVFESMLLQFDPGRLGKYLRVFGRRALPAFDSRLLQYADHEVSEIRCLANRALSNYSHPAVRQLAIERLKRGRFLEDELILLKRNYQEGDAAIIEGAIEIPADRDQLHGVIFELVGLFEANLVEESANAMYFVYEQSPCSNCRAKAVRILLDTSNAQDWLLEECRHDSQEETRTMVRISSDSDVVGD